MAQSMGGGVTAVPRTFGILSIVFSGLSLVGSLFGLIGLVVPVVLKHAPPTTRPEDAAAMRMLSNLYLAGGLVSAIFTVMSGWLLALGIGQLRYRKWAAAWSVRWGVVALGALAVMAVLVTQMMSSTLGSMMTATDVQNAAQAGRQVSGMLGGLYAAMMVVFYAPYPILLMIFFSRERVRAAMTA